MPALINFASVRYSAFHHLELQQKWVYSSTGLKINVIIPSLFYFKSAITLIKLLFFSIFNISKNRSQMPYTGILCKEAGRLHVILFLF
jgi:hypothetical protein